MRILLDTSASLRATAKQVCRSQIENLVPVLEDGSQHRCMIRWRKFTVLSVEFTDYKCSFTKPVWCYFFI